MFVQTICQRVVNSIVSKLILNLYILKENIFFSSENTSKVLYELRNWIESGPNFYAHFPIEVRFVKKDDIYLSPAFGRNSTFINIIMYRPYGKDVPFEKYWNKYEEIMKAAGGRPHWAKVRIQLVFSDFNFICFQAHRETAKDFIKMYPRFEEWKAIRKRLDPDNMFMNLYLERIFFSDFE